MDKRQFKANFVHCKQSTLIEHFWCSYNVQFLIPELLNPELLISELLIPELLISELLIPELLISEILIPELLIPGAYDPLFDTRTEKFRSGI
jgi:hypothetical protein